MQLDELDAAILRALAEDARRSLRDVAVAVASTPTTVSGRLERLRAIGLVQGATLRFDPVLLPGKARVATGHVGPDRAADVLRLAAGLPGVVEAAVTADGRLLVLLQVRDLEQEEAIVSRLVENGCSNVAVSAGRRASGPPPVHLFDAPVVVIETCATCGKNVGADALTEAVDGRRVPFCCTSCRGIYLDRYARHRAAAGGDRRSTSS